MPSDDRTTNLEIREIAPRFAVKISDETDHIDTNLLLRWPPVTMSDECTLCGGSALHPILDLGHSPPSDRFLTEEELSEPEIHYPLKVVICDDCSLIQLDYTVPPEELFTETFVYQTGHNETLKRHFEHLVDELVAEFGLGEGDFVVDIGSNDGTLLSNYPDDIEVLGVDPSKAADVAIDRGIPTEKAFFTDELAEEIVADFGYADVVTCTNTFAHVDDLNSLMAGIKRLLGDGGIFVQESHYFLNLVEKMQYDEIYHEHLRYYTLESLSNLFEQYDMEVVAAERVEPHGGSLQTYAAERGTYEIDESVTRVRDREWEAGINSRTRLADFAESVHSNRRTLTDLLTDLRSEGNRIVGVGAAAKGMSLLNSCRVGPELLEYIAETNEFKIGKYTPGTHIPIVDEEEMFGDDPDYALLLAWNLKDVLVPKIREKGFGGKFILPNTEVEVVQ